MKNWIKFGWSYFCWSFLEKKIHAPQYFVSNNVFSWTSWHTSGEKKACNENLWCFWERPREKIIFYSSIFEHCFILNAICFAMSRIRCIQWKEQKSFDVKGKISREDKDGFSKKPSQGNITIFLRMCRVQLKNTNWKAVKVQLNSIIDHNMLSVCH